MQPVLTVAEMQAVDRSAQATTSVDILIERAGTAVASAALEMMGGAYGRRVVVIAGKGNNGADGRVAAGVLRRRGARVQLVDPAHGQELPPADLVIDAAFGTGFRGVYRAPGVAAGTLVLAVDIPSGVLGDTGEVTGDALAADRTVALAALKPGLLQGDGVELAGRVTVADIGLAVEQCRVHLLEDGDVADLVPRRKRGGNKWHAAVLVVAGSPGMTGAAALCARAAFRAGAGMVRLGVPGGEVADSPAAEAVSFELPPEGWADVALEQAERFGAIVVGPGIGRSPSMAEQVHRLVTQTEVPLVIDADGLFALGRLDGEPLRPRPTVVLTPHDGEYGRLLDEPPGPDRIGAARQLAAAGGVVALVKGGTTAVAAPDGRALLVTAGSPRLATAGTGDVLSGVIGAFLARGMEPTTAAALAAHVHGLAAKLGPAEGLMAGDLPDLVSSVLSQLCLPETAPGAGQRHG